MSQEHEVSILKISIENAELEAADWTIFRGFEIIRGYTMQQALRFMYEIYRSVGETNRLVGETKGCSGLRVNSDTKTAYGVSSNTFIYEIVEWNRS